MLTAFFFSSKDFMIKAVFFDIDGTLASFNTHKISPMTREAIAILKSKGIKVFIASGRSAFELQILDNIQFDGYIILNGSHCFTSSGKDIYKHPISKEDISRLVDWLKNDPTPFLFVHSAGQFINRINDEVKQIAKLVEVAVPIVMPIEHALDKDIFQLSGYFAEGEKDDLFIDILTQCEQARWCPYFTDIIAKGNNKSNGIQHILDFYNIDISETMAFGDGGNDISMLKYVSIGIAMGNASEEVKAAADYVTKSVDDEGIYQALKHFNLL